MEEIDATPDEAYELGQVTGYDEGYRAAVATLITSGEPVTMLGATLAEFFDREADHWDAEYERITQESGGNGQLKLRAAYRLGSIMLHKRADEYRTGEVSYTVEVGNEN